MARGDTTPPRRSRFDDSAEAPAPDFAPKRLRYPCRANNCPLPGTIFLGGSDSGICAWHYGSNGDEIPKVTQTALDWACITSEIEAARQLLNDPASATNPRAHRDALFAAWGRVLPSVVGSGWKHRMEALPSESYGEWALRMERFLLNRVKERITDRVIADDDSPTPLVAEMRERLRGSLTAPTAGDFA